ncbi:MAG: regulatory iron-sulfur-containing complex subunit RicT [Cryomorphaceae bacterium]
MGCESCTNGSNGTPAGCKNNGTCSSGGCSKLAVYDWLSNMELPGNMKRFAYVEVRFKGSRKDFYENTSSLSLNPGDCIVVEGSPGYDVGVVSAEGELARLQMDKKKLSKNTRDIKRILRKATTDDLTVWRESRALESNTMFTARGISSSLGLEMKISDVEYQGDKTKATFYYTADGRVDFRELIRKFAETFRVRIEMKQIGARQEAARLGGIGSCGRELCCSTWLTDFRSVSTSAARYQQLSLNTQKLAGQCGKLKCCLNYELDSYLDAIKHLPKSNIKLRTKKGIAFHIKTDIFKGIMWYVYEEGSASGPIPLAAERVKEIIEMNENKKFPEDLQGFVEIEAPKEEAYSNVVGQDSLTRFDKKKTNRKKRRKPRGNKPPQANAKSGGKPSSGKKKRPPRGKGGNNPQNTAKPKSGNRKPSGNKGPSNKK